MPQLISRMLMVGERPPSNLQIQIDHVFRFSDLGSAGALQIDVVILPFLIATSDEAKKYLRLILHGNPSLQIVLIAGKNIAPLEVQNYLNEIPVFYIVESILNNDFENVVVSAVTRAQQIKQDIQIEEMINENNDLLKNLYRDLEAKVQKRQESLLESSDKAFQASTKLQTILNVTELIQQADSIEEIERTLTELLAEAMGISQVRLMPNPHDETFDQQNVSRATVKFFRIPLLSGDDGRKIGSLFFRRTDDKPVKSSDKDYLQKISEVVGLALDRFSKLHQIVERKNIWDSTFNSITDPVMIVNKEYEIIQVNRAFAVQAKMSGAELTGRKCYQMLFQRDQACFNCHLGKNFKIEINKPEKAVYDVSSQPLSLPTEKSEIYVHQYHNITENEKMERKILESARMAEIGVIGSSIAHELNNPLGGMLSFTQLIKLEMAKDHSMYEDMNELESGIKRCRDIVQNLLGFTRNPGIDEKKVMDIRDVIQRAIKIIELQTRSMGIEIKLGPMEQKISVEGYLNHLTQAVQNLLQSAISGIVEQIKIFPTFKGVIELQLFEDQNSVTLNILDNSPVAENPAAIGLSVARQILHDHGGNLEFQGDLRPFRVAKISLPRPVLPN